MNLFITKFNSIIQNQLGKIVGGNCTFSICRTTTNDPKYECGDTNVVCSNDKGEVYESRTDENDCEPLT